MTFGTLDRSDEKAWLDQNIPTYLHTYLLTYLPTYLECTSIREHTKGAIIGTCDIWDTDYNTANWEPGFMTIFVTWQLIVTLDSIHKWDVFILNLIHISSSIFDISSFMAIIMSDPLDACKKTKRGRKHPIFRSNLWGCHNSVLSEVWQIKLKLRRAANKTVLPALTSQSSQSDISFGRGPAANSPALSGSSPR